jgi:hypothetical protein
VNRVFGLAPATRKDWLISPEYGYTPAEYPTHPSCFAPVYEHEADLISDYFAMSGVDPTVGRVCVDITGFMRPHLLFLMKYLHVRGVRKFDVLYSEPSVYLHKEKTRFSDESVVAVRQVAGFEGNHTPEAADDWLIIGAGYDHALIAYVAEHKESARKAQMLGLPSLRADMYQENVLRAHRAAEQVGGAAGEPDISYLASANDPFNTATALSEIRGLITRNGRISNLYLCPLSTKVQALGFGLFYLHELLSSPASIIFPFCRRYARETSQGISRVWWYQVELPA